jgi:CBS domain-containing protein
MNVRDLIAAKGRDVVTLDPSATLSMAARLLAEKRIGAAVVTGAGYTVAGILSERDIVRAIGERGERALDEPISMLMTRKVVTCTESDTVPELMERMTAGRFRHVPVVERGRLVGIVSIGDVVKHRLDEMEREQSAMRDYIMTA